MASPMEYASLPVDEGEGGTPERPHPRSRIVALSASDKWRLVKPIIPKYMLPLCKCPTLCIRIGLLILTPPKVFVYLVGRHLGKSPSNLLTNLFLVRVYNQPGSLVFYASSPNLRLKVCRASLRLCCIRSHLPGNTLSLPR
jgi:hypothetical protein